MKTKAEMERVGADGQCFVQYPVAADAFEVDALVQQVPLEVFGADGSGSQGGLRVDQNVPVRGLRPGGAALGEPGQQGLVGQFAESLGVPGDGDPAVGRVEVVQGEVTDGRGAGGVDGGQGDDQPLRRGGGDPLDGEHFGVGHRQQAAWDVFRLEAGSGVGEDQAALLSEAEQ
ncbi:hypothetical protein BOG92_002515 [Streptomyces sp. WAC00263]|nr:hypothetical protein BOG92_002515 [Streptomyces sp. WAC00263]